MSKDVEDGKEKSERKRQREKQRRSELTNAFDDLSALVLKMDTAADEEEPNKKNRRLSAGRSEHDNEHSGGMTRVDLINRALAIMNRMHKENSELKAELSRSRGGGKDEVGTLKRTCSSSWD